jgi:hypothetical protein
MTMTWAKSFSVKCTRAQNAVCEAAFASSAVSDGLGHVIIAGTFEGEMDFGAVGTLVSAGGTDGFVVKFTECCGDVVWANRVGGVGDDMVTGASFGTDRSVMIAGRAQGNVSAGMRPPPSMLNKAEWSARYGSSGSESQSKVFAMQLCEETGEEQWLTQSTGTPFDVLQQHAITANKATDSAGKNNGTCKDAVRIAGFRGRGVAVIANIDASQPQNFAGKLMVGNTVEIGGKLMPYGGSRVYVASFATSAAAMSEGALLDEKLVKGVVLGIVLSLIGMCVLACALRAFGRCLPKKLKVNVRNKKKQLSKRLGRYGKLGLPRSRGDGGAEEEKRLEAVYEDDAEYEYEEENGLSPGDHELDDVDPDKP